MQAFINSRGNLILGNDAIKANGILFRPNTTSRKTMVVGSKTVYQISKAPKMAGMTP